MGKSTRIYSKWQGYSLADCACEVCANYAGKKKPCPLEVCCCVQERTDAISREMAIISASILKAAA